MYIGYLEDRKLLGYPALKDTSRGIKLVLITDSTVLLIRNIPLNVKDKSKIIMVVICLGVLLVFGNAEPVEAEDNWFLPGAEGFCPPRQTYSREFSSMTIKTQENPANENTKSFKWDRQFEIGENYIIMKDSQVLRKFKHAFDFGVTCKPCRQNFEIFKNKIIDHMKNPSTVVRKGTFKKNIDVTHYTDYETGLNVIIRNDNNEFLSCWKLRDKQLKNVKNRGTL